MTEQQTSPENCTEVKPKKTYRSNLSILFLFILVIGFAGWNYHERTTIQESLSHLQEEQATLLLATQTLSKQQHHAEATVRQLNHHLKMALEQRFYENQNWLLLKARYYLDLAQINSQWTNNNKTTIALLESSDKILSSVTNPQVLPIRQALAHDITTIKATPSVDSAGLLSELDAAQSLIDKIPLNPSLIKPTPTENQTTATDPKWQQFDKSLSFLKKLVIVKKQSDDFAILTSPLHESMWRESIRMNVQEAKWAIMNDQPEVFQQALQQTLTDVNRLFDSQAVSTRSLVERLTALQKVSIQSTKHSFDESILMLDKLINSTMSNS